MGNRERPLRLTEYHRTGIVDEVHAGPRQAVAAWTDGRAVVGLLSGPFETVRREGRKGVLIVTEEALGESFDEMVRIAREGTLVLVAGADDVYRPVTSDILGRKNKAAPHEPILPAPYPRSFLDRPIGDLGLTRRLAEELSDCVTIGDVAALPAGRITAASGLSFGAVARLRRRADNLFNFADAGRFVEKAPPEVAGQGTGAGVDPPSSSPPAEAAPYDVATPFVDHLGPMVECLPDRQAEAVRGRTGIGQAPQTYRMLAARHGVCVERIRQITVQGLDAIDRESGAIGAIRREILAMPVPTPFDVLRQASWAAGMEQHTLEWLIEHVAGLQRVVVRGVGEFACSFHWRVWNRHYVTLKETVERAAPDDAVEEVIARYVAGIPDPVAARDCEALARAILRGPTALDAQVGLGLYGPVALSILPADGTAVTLDEIRRSLAVRQRPVVVGEAALRKILQQKALHLGVDHYASKDGPVPVKVVRHCRSVLDPAGGPRSRSACELIGSLVEAGVEGVSGMTAADLSAILMRDGRFIPQGRFRWTVGKGGADLSVDGMVARILSENGGPMHKEEIYDALRPLWGTLVPAQFVPGATICLVDQGILGLAARDIPQTPEQREAIVEAALPLIVEGVRTAAEVYDGIAVLCSGFKVGNPFLLASILRIDAGVESGFRGILRLSGQPRTPRAGSLRGEVAGILRDHPDGISRQGILDAIEARTGEKGFPHTVRNYIRIHGRRIAPDLWTAA